MHFYQLGFYGKPAAYNQDQPWFDAAAKYLDETQVPDQWELTFSSTQPELTFNDYTYFTQPLRLVEPFVDSFYMEIDFIDDNTEVFNQNITNDNWDDIYTIDIGIGEFNRGTAGVNNAYASLKSIDNAYEITVGRLGTGNCFISSDYYSWSDELGDIETSIEGVSDFSFVDNPVSTNTKFTVGIGIKGNQYSIYTDSSGTWTEYPSAEIEGMEISQIDNCKIGIMLYSGNYNKNNLQPYLDHLKVIVRFRHFAHMDTAQKYYPDIQTYNGGE